MNKLKSKLKKEVIAVKSAIETKNECLELEQSIEVSQLIIHQSILPGVDQGVQDIELERQVKPHMASYSYDLGSKVEVIAAQSYDHRMDDNDMDADEEPQAPPFDPMLPGKKKVVTKIVPKPEPVLKKEKSFRRASTIRRHSSKNMFDKKFA